MVMDNKAFEDAWEINRPAYREISMQADAAMRAARQMRAKARELRTRSETIRNQTRSLLDRIHSQRQ